ncbi:MAG TPA: VOC family protein [Thermohalobaculum sp.]|nr:VOC family protein [Thermohalobaculum sp.]
MITAFNHTSFTVTDMDRSVRFWTETLGFKAASVSPRSGEWQAAVTGVAGAELLIAHLHGYGAHIEFIQYMAGAAPPQRIDPNMTCASHVCFEVSDIEKIWARLIAAGASPQGEITAVVDGPMQGVRAAYLRDPGGIIIEIVELPPKAT